MNLFISKNNKDDSMAICENMYKCIYRGSYHNIPTYFSQLKDKIIEEMRTQGFSPFAENIEKSLYKNSYVDAIIISVFITATKELNGEKTVISLYYLPNITIDDDKVLWTESEKKIQINNNISDYVMEFIAVGREKHLEYIDSLRNNRPANNQKTENGIIRNAENETEKIRINIQENENHILSSAESETKSENIISEAKKQAEKIISVAKEKADEIIRSAGKQADEITVNAEKQADEIKEKAEKDADEIKEQAERNLKAETISEKNKIIKQYLDKDRQKYKQECEQELYDIAKDSKNRAGDIEKIHNEMCDKTNEFHAMWVQSLNGFKQEFYNHLHKWQASLYPSEIKDIAQRYTELYKTINVDRLITEEALYQYNNDKQNDMHDRMTASPSTVEGLNRLNITLTKFLKKFEQSLSGFGMYVFYPKENEKFDEILHSAVEDDDYYDFDNAVIERCIVPGIIKKATDDGDDDVIIPAEVKIKNYSN